MGAPGALKVGYEIGGLWFGVGAEDLQVLVGRDMWAESRELEIPFEGLHA